MSSWGMKKHVAKYHGLRNETVEFYVHMTVHSQFAIQKVRDQDISNYNIARCSVWVWNLVANIEGGT